MTTLSIKLLVMAVRWLWGSVLVAPFACGHATESRPTAGQCGQGTGAAAMEPTSGAPAAAGVGGALGGASGAPPGSAGSSDDASAGAAEGGATGRAHPLVHASCESLAATCGLAQASCCDAPEIPGAAFTRYNGTQASVSAFRLDRFEVTVGRFRAFVEHYGGALPAARAGKNARDPQDSGWDPAWSQELPPGASELVAALDCSLRLAAWDDEPGANENRPINCVTWYEAQAFCIWDGGRLPSDLEWEYAAQGGDGRRYPWGNDEEPSPHAFANADNGCRNALPDERPECKGLLQIWPVGSAPGGDGRWGQSDLAGNLWEYTVDYFGPALGCSDCARHVPDAPGTGETATHVARGGSYDMDLGDGLVDRDFYYPKGPRDARLGFRCAYAAKLE